MLVRTSDRRTQFVAPGAASLAASRTDSRRLGDLPTNVPALGGRVAGDQNFCKDTDSEDVAEPAHFLLGAKLQLKSPLVVWVEVPLAPVGR